MRLPPPNFPQLTTASLRVALRWPLVRLLLVMTLLKVIAIYAYVPGSATLLDVGFGFEPYVQSLMLDGRFAACDNHVCDYATRMPGVPYFLLGTSFFANDLRTAALIKTVFLSSLLILLCRNFAGVRLTHSVMQRRALFALAAFLTLSPNLIKHAAMPFYEEGYILEVLALAAISLMSLLTSNTRTARAARYVVPVAAVSAAYLFKSSLVVVWLVTSLFVAYIAARSHRRGLASVLIALALVAPTGWMLHNWTHGGRATMMSSFDGENIFRGWNVHTLDMYPDCTLDLLFQPVAVCGARTVAMPTEPSRAGFATEWEWNDHYVRRARDWVIRHPAAALETLGTKFYTVFFSIRIVPHYRVSEGARDTDRSAPEELLTGGWLFLGRLAEGAWLATSVYLMRQGDGQARRVAAASFAFPIAYALPYVLGFGYERHFSLLIMLVTLCLMFVLLEITRFRSRQTHQDLSVRPHS